MRTTLSECGKYRVRFFGVRPDEADGPTGERTNGAFGMLEH
jgi:hypothetical protein